MAWRGANLLSPLLALACSSSVTGFLAINARRCSRLYAVWSLGLGFWLSADRVGTQCAEQAGRADNCCEGDPAMESDLCVVGSPGWASPTLPLAKRHGIDTPGTEFRHR